MKRAAPNQKTHQQKLHPVDRSASAGPQGMAMMPPVTLGDIPTKLTINQPGDDYEKEADRAAEHVMRMSVSDHRRADGGQRGNLLAHKFMQTLQQRWTASSPPLIQRQAAQPGQAAPQQQPPDPARAEWDAHPGIHRHFANGFQTYAQLRPLYQAQGVQNPAEYINDNIVYVTFFGHRTPAHVDMRAPLQAAEQTLRSQNIVPAIRSFWAFVPRMTAAGRLSNHAFGRAFDINPGENPHIRNRHDIRIIRAVTGVDLGQPQTAPAMRQASQAFQQTFNQGWLDQQSQQLEQLRSQHNPSRAVRGQIRQLQGLIQSVNARRNSLDGYAQTGFLNLEQPLIDALIGAGFTWGGQWQHEKDFMHFEL